MQPTTPPHEQQQRQDRSGPAVVEDHSREPALEKKERSVGRTLLHIATAAVIIALFASSLVMRDWVLLGIAVVVFVPYAFLLMAPLWLARTTHKAQQVNERPRSEQR